MRVAYQIPKYDQDPSEEMIDFLAQNPLPWDGDECGINLSLPDGSEIVGIPGDWVVRAEDGVYRIVQEADYVPE